MVLKFSQFLLESGFVQSKAYYSLFTRQTGSSFRALLVYVKDISLASNDIQAILDFMHVIDDRFKINDFGTLQFFLGLEVARSTKGIWLRERKFALDILTYTSFLGSQLVKTHVEQNQNLDSVTGAFIT